MDGLRVGTAQKEVTPSLPIDLIGYIRRLETSTGIHDPLLANFLAIENGINQVLFISVDILFMGNDFSLRVRNAISKELKIEKKNILIASTHTHSAPGIHLFRDEGIRDKDWEEKVFNLLIKGAAEAIQKLKKASLVVGTGTATMGKNRRTEGGPTDPNLPILFFFDERELPMAIIANYGCHPVVLDERNLLISADYIGYFRNYLNEFFSSDIVILFFTGASADVDPVNRGSFSIAEKLGTALAKEALKAISKMEFKKNVEIEVKEASLKIPYGRIPNHQEAEKVYEDIRLKYEEAVKKEERIEIKIKKAFLLWAEEVRKKASENKLPIHLESELQCIKLGDTVFFAFPFELFSSISLSLRQMSQIENLFMVGYANGYNGYLPDESSFLEGGYEVEEAFKYVGLLPFSSQAEKIFKEKALFLIEN